MLFLSRISVINRKLVAFLSVLVVALGVYATLAVKQQLLPDLSFPAVTVVVPYPGAAPEVVEQQVVLPIEDALKGLDGVEDYRSTSAQGSATVSLTFDYAVDLDAAAGAVRQALAQLAPRLPGGVDPQVATGSLADLPTMTLAATGDGDQRQLGVRLATGVVPALRAVDGVNEVTLSGTRDQLITVTPRDGIPAAAVTAALASLGGTSSAGSISSDGKDVSLAVGREVTSLAQIEDLWVTPGPVRLGDVASVRLTDAPATSITRTNGRPSLGITITMTHDGSASSISDEVRDLLPELTAPLGDGAALTVVSDNGPAVQQAVHGLLEEGLLGLAMAVLVIVLFLRSIRSTIVTAVSIPLSLLIALIAVWQRDYSLNLLTLGALTLAVGRVVDDSIVVLENIKRHLGYGEPRDRAILTAVREVSTAVIASTLTTVAVFLPIGLVGGLIGELFSPFAITVTVAMLASLLVSLTVVPALAYWFLRGPAATEAVSPDDERDGFLQRRYLPVITWSVHHRKTVLGSAAVLLALTALMFTGLKTSFLGDAEQTSLGITQTLPAGTGLDTTDAAVARAEQVIDGVDGVTSYQVRISGAVASYTLTLDPDFSQETLRERLEAVPGDIVVAAAGVAGSNIQVSVQAPDDATLRAATDQVRQAVAGVPEVTDVRSDLGESSPRISVVTRGEQAARRGLTDEAILAVLRQAVAGTTVRSVTVDGTPHDIVVRTGGTAPDSLAAVRALPVPVTGGDVRLDQVATVTLSASPAERTRVDGHRVTTVTATPAGDDTGAASTAVTGAVSALRLPAGATYTIGGVTADQDEAFNGLILAMAAAIALVFLVLVAVFRSIRQTLILLVSVPFALVGAVALLLVTGTPLGLAALIGILMLIGIVVTNAIVLMDLINQYRERGLPVAEAVVEGGLRRLRPILMTALATIFALLPMGLGITGAGGFISQPLAVVVIGGLVSSTALTLVLIPVLYTMVETRRSGRPVPAVPEPDLVTAR
ncbi:efflux RND transporter permease subunit [Actinoplanes sp. NPDC051494]|uniref:efflux RND transporter permease subunit n=1 Tax=Actinoplanes sp. NPDC051494 TaxID=3363907 RepID=UPI003792D72F